MKCEKYMDRRRLQFKEKYGVEYLSQLDAVKQKISNTHIAKRQERLSDRFNDIIIAFPDKDLVEIRCPACKEKSVLNIEFMLQRDKFNIDLCLHYHETYAPWSI